jgi:hypothetical protein
MADAVAETDIAEFLYPEVGDPAFAAKIARHKEFADTPYDGEIRDVRAHADQMCREGFEIAPHQWFIKNFLSTNTPYNGMLLYAGLGTGKCMGADSRIMMADGSIRLVQDIEPGDELMGDDGAPRAVLSTTRGWDTMYTVSRAGADPYVVNGAHILCLVAADMPCVCGGQVWDVDGHALRVTAIHPPPDLKFVDEMRDWTSHAEHDVVEITVDDYLRLPLAIQQRLRGYRAKWHDMALCADAGIDAAVAAAAAYVAGRAWTPADPVPARYAMAVRAVRVEFLTGVAAARVTGAPLGAAPTARTVLLDVATRSAAIEIQTLARSVGLCCDLAPDREGVACIHQRANDPVLLPGKDEVWPSSVVYDMRFPTPISVSRNPDEAEYFGFTLDGNGRYVLGDLTVTHNTCSAIGVAEDMREYIKKMNLDGCSRATRRPRVIVIASPSVQQNFRMQLFDESKLREVNGVWDIRSCVGAALVHEVSPSDTVTSVDKADLAKKIHALIRETYSFKGYDKFRLDVEALIRPSDELSAADNAARATRRVREQFDNTLIIVDEVHNLRLEKDDRALGTVEDTEGADDAEEAEGAAAEKTDGQPLKMFKYVVRRAENLKLLFLSATPMYNSHKEIVWIANLLNLNDRRPRVRVADIFASAPARGESVFAPATATTESGAEILRRKIAGYVSYVRSENPYTFPYRIYPADFAPDRSFMSGTGPARPTRRYDGAEITETDYSLDLYVSPIGAYQEFVYLAAIENLVHSKTSQLLSPPHKALTMTFPLPASVGGADDGDDKIPVDQVIGKVGMARVMQWQVADDGVPEWYDFRYANGAPAHSDRIFHRDNIGLYSSKIAAVCSAVAASTGLVLVFAQFIDAGCVPMALALEEMGLTRYTPRVAGTRNPSGNLFGEAHYAAHPSAALDAATMRPRAALPPGAPFTQARYTIISQDKSALTPDMTEAMRVMTHPDNRAGALVKVVIISMAGSEGIDFKYVRQIHVIDPWYHMNRIEQIIGRGVRNLSHCALPFEERNVEIYLHATSLRSDPSLEAMDVYMYRFAEDKARRVGEVSRLLKENAVDCVINHAQTNFSMENLATVDANREIQMRLSSGATIPYAVGDRPMSVNCDYMPNCVFSCAAGPGPAAEASVAAALSTYHAEFANTNGAAILRKVRDMFRDGPAFTLAQISRRVNAVRQYPIEQIYQVLSRLTEDPSEHVVDRYGRVGRMVNAGQYYLFQPAEITDPTASILDRATPVDVKPLKILVELRDASGKSRASIASEGASEGCVSTILAAMWISFREATAPLKLAKVDARKRWSWYAHARDVAPYLAEVHGIAAAAFTQYIARHLFDSLMVHEKTCVLAALYATERGDEFSAAPALDAELKRYIDGLLLYAGDQQGIMLTDASNAPALYVRDAGGKWRAAPPSALVANLDAAGRDLSFATAAAAQRVVQPGGAVYVGYMACFKQTEMVFNVLDMRELRNNHYKGSRVDQMSKNVLMSVVDTLPLTYDYDRDAMIGLYQRGLCVVLELLMRNVPPGPGATFATDAGFEQRVRGRGAAAPSTKLNI